MKLFISGSKNINCLTDKAKELLKTGDPIISIYNKCGFQDYTSFFRAFKKEYGITPKEFQNHYFSSFNVVESE